MVDEIVSMLDEVKKNEYPMLVLRSDGESRDTSRDNWPKPPHLPIGSVELFIFVCITFGSDQWVSADGIVHLRVNALLMGSVSSRLGVTSFDLYKLGILPSWRGLARGTASGGPRLVSIAPYCGDMSWISSSSRSNGIADNPNEIVCLPLTGLQ